MNTFIVHPVVEQFGITPVRIQWDEIKPDDTVISKTCSMRDKVHSQAWLSVEVLHCILRRVIDSEIACGRIAEVAPFESGDYLLEPPRFNEKWSFIEPRVKFNEERGGYTMRRNPEYREAKYQVYLKLAKINSVFQYAERPMSGDMADFWEVSALVPKTVDWTPANGISYYKRPEDQIHPPPVPTPSIFEKSA